MTKNSRIKRAIELLFSVDAYKLDHINQYPKGTNLIYSYISARKSSINYIDKIYSLGIYEGIGMIISNWKENFFSLTTEELDETLKVMDNINKKIFINREIDVNRFRELWKEGDLLNAIKIKYLNQDSIVEFGTPLVKIWNTNKEFYWLPNFLETSLISNLWPIITNSTKAFYLKELLLRYAKKSSMNTDYVEFQAHDFSYRGLPLSGSAKFMNLGHMHFFRGSDTLPAILNYNNLISQDKDWRGNSVIATEHSIMSAYGKENEFKLFSDLIEKYSDGIISIVSDTYDYFNVINEFLPKLKDKIMKIKGKIIIRPDSGDPIKIVEKTISRLWEIFGGTVNKKGYRVLNPKIGIIYGDGFDFLIVEAILKSLLDKGYSSENIIFGIGAKIYNESTRDSFNFAMQASYIEINNIGRGISKSPQADSEKKSRKGLLSYKDNKTRENVSWDESNNDDLIFWNYK